MSSVQCARILWEKSAAIIGEVVHEHAGMLTMKTRVGGSRVVDLPAGEQLPRIC